MDYLCCLRCFYDLSGQRRLCDDAGTVRCPECGELWGVKAVRDKWKERLFLKLPTNIEGGE